MICIRVCKSIYMTINKTDVKNVNATGFKVFAPGQVVF